MSTSPTITLSRPAVQESTYQDSNNSKQIGSLKGRSVSSLFLNSGEKGGADPTLIAITCVAFIALLALRIALRLAIIALINNPVVGLSILGVVALTAAVAAGIIYMNNR